MKDRIKQIRKELHLTQPEFADKIGVSRPSVAKYEAGTVEPSEAVLRGIAAAGSCSLEWLKTGEGEMRADQDRTDEIARIVNEALATTPEEDRAYFAQLMASLSDAEISLLAQIVRKMFRK